VWETADPDGRRVILSAARWLHVCERHPDLGGRPEDLLEVVANPDARKPGREPGEEWFYRRSVGPSRWIRVVVHYERKEGRITTAFARRGMP
jgi:hypothetical protein